MIYIELIEIRPNRPSRIFFYDKRYSGSSFIVDIYHMASSGPIVFQGKNFDAFFPLVHENTFKALSLIINMELPCKVDWIDDMVLSYRILFNKRRIFLSYVRKLGLDWRSPFVLPEDFLF